MCCLIRWWSSVFLDVKIREKLEQFTFFILRKILLRTRLAFNLAVLKTVIIFLLRNYNYVEDFRCYNPRNFTITQTPSTTTQLSGILDYTYKRYLPTRPATSGQSPFTHQNTVPSYHRRPQPTRNSLTPAWTSPLDEAPSSSPRVALTSKPLTVKCARAPRQVSSDSPSGWLCACVCTRNRGKLLLTPRNLERHWSFNQRLIIWIDENGIDLN